MSIAQRIEDVRTSIRAACERAGRREEEIELVAVSKRQSVRAVEEAYAAGQRLFGESYADELVEKVHATRHLDGISFRFIGHLQRNKARRVAMHADAIDSVDSLRLAKALARHTEGLDILIQVQVVAEATKAGIDITALPALLREIQALPSLHVRGLMTLPPRDPSAARMCFERLADLAAGQGLTHLSMGMSNDLGLAIECGSTMVRVGTAIFGPRS